MFYIFLTIICIIYDRKQYSLFKVEAVVFRYYDAIILLIMEYMKNIKKFHFNTNKSEIDFCCVFSNKMSLISLIIHFKKYINT